MRDILGEKTAIDQTRAILRQVEPGSLPKKMHKDLVRKILDNQLKRFTNYNRLQRHKTIKDLLKKRTESEQKPFPAPPISKNKSNSKVLNKKHSENIAGQGSQ